MRLLKAKKIHTILLHTRSQYNCECCIVLSECYCDTNTERETNTQKKMYIPISMILHVHLGTNVVILLTQFAWWFRFSWKNVIEVNVYGFQIALFGSKLQMKRKEIITLCYQSGVYYSAYMHRHFCCGFIPIKSTTCVCLGFIRYAMINFSFELLKSLFMRCKLSIFWNLVEKCVTMAKSLRKQFLQSKTTIDYINVQFRFVYFFFLFLYWFNGVE